ncbi:MAG TPA: hypothetical protein VEW42_03745 [Candidatus Eisenbacteria bacterium]|nr:hypothetical protein [Candidatus Eisenbacteria bacterium]
MSAEKTTSGKPFVMKDVSGSGDAVLARVRAAADVNNDSHGNGHGRGRSTIVATPATPRPSNG